MLLHWTTCEVCAKFQEVCSAVLRCLVAFRASYLAAVSDMKGFAVSEKQTLHLTANQSGSAFLVCKAYRPASDQHQNPLSTCHTQFPGSQQL